MSDLCMQVEERHVANEVCSKADIILWTVIASDNPHLETTGSLYLFHCKHL